MNDFTILLSPVIFSFLLQFNVKCVIWNLPILRFFLIFFVMNNTKMINSYKLNESCRFQCCWKVYYLYVHFLMRIKKSPHFSITVNTVETLIIWKLKPHQRFPKFIMISNMGTKNHYLRTFVNRLYIKMAIKSQY